MESKEVSDKFFEEHMPDKFWSWKDLDGRQVHVQVITEPLNEEGEMVTYVFLTDLETKTTYVTYGD